VLAEQWLAHFRDLIESAVSDVEARRAIQDKVRVLAMVLVNEGREPSELRARPHGTCLRYEPAIESISLARRGDAAALRRLMKRAPDILDSAPHAARLLQLAVLGGLIALWRIRAHLHRAWSIGDIRQACIRRAPHQSELRP
jgi:hypothetical protein